MHVRASMYVCMRACVRVRVCVRVCGGGGGGEGGGGGVQLSLELYGDGYQRVFSPEGVLKLWDKE